MRAGAAESATSGVVRDQSDPVGLPSFTNMLTMAGGAMPGYDQNLSHLSAKRWPAGEQRLETPLLLELSRALGALPRELAHDNGYKC